MGKFCLLVEGAFENEAEPGKRSTAVAANQARLQNVLQQIRAALIAERLQGITVTLHVEGAAEKVLAASRGRVE